MIPQIETVFHVTVLSNFARAYDKYSRSYVKDMISESTFPNQFFVLRSTELHIGIEKANALLSKLALRGNRLLVLQARLSTASLHDNIRTGKGRYLLSTQLQIDELFIVDPAGRLEPIIPEEAYAASLSLVSSELAPYSELKPRTLSVLPIARACQASCKFCFSESSVSLEQLPHVLDIAQTGNHCARAKLAGAERFVITGGGEPGLVRHSQMLELIRLGRKHFDKVVLISNGYHLAKLEPEERFRRLLDYADAGLTVLSISRHFSDATVNHEIMGLDTQTERILESFQQYRTHLTAVRLRLICVLQKGGVQDVASLEQYMDWAIAQGGREFCFKELYVSSMTESVYHSNPENQWSLKHQVPLSLITEHFSQKTFVIANRLPWGAPVFEGKWKGHPITVAAYTEPSLFWERSHRVARSWNVMADGQCLVSLEDPSSALPNFRRHAAIPIMEIA
jgi:molybdenum cofactor biosynthesis enzyme MoaA